MVEDHSDNERILTATTTWTTVSNKEENSILYAPSRRQDRTYTKCFSEPLLPKLSRFNLLESKTTTCDGEYEILKNIYFAQSHEFSPSLYFIVYKLQDFAIKVFSFLQNPVKCARACCIVCSTHRGRSLPSGQSTNMCDKPTRGRFVRIRKWKITD